MNLTLDNAFELCAFLLVLAVIIRVLADAGNDKK